MNFSPKKHYEDFLFLPLGGANEIGMNLNLYHLDGKWLMVDCGVGFAYDVPGIDMMTPDISFIKKERKNLLGIVITHIHEDHIGAVQYLWEELQVPVYTTKLAANFLRAKLKEFKLDKVVPIHLIEPEKNLKLGSFEIEFLGLTHSVPEMQALFIKTRHGNVLHSGDWKFDPDPVVGNVSEKEKISAYGDRDEILALVCDSTNAINEGHSGSEGDLHKSLKALIAGRTGLVGVTTFASNIARIHTIATVAKELGRKVVLAGFSLHRISEVARKSGYLGEQFEFISDREMKAYDKSELLVLCTGCQGEQNAAARKIATDKHPTIRFRKGDLMIFSSKIIPGNEKKIFELFDELAKKQIDVMTEKDHFVHVSGHPYQDELREIYHLARPKIAIPVHGEFIHTKTHGELAKECGVPHVIQVENGSVVKLSGGDFKSSQQIAFVKSGYLGIDGNQLVDLKSEVISERRKLQESGIVTISLALTPSLKLLSEPRIKCVGSYDLENDRDAEEFLIKELQFILKTKTKELRIDDGFASKLLKKCNKKQKKRIKSSNISKELEKTIRSKMLKIFEDLMGKRPALEVLTHIID